MPWSFDPRAARYRDTETGRFLSQARAMEFVNQSIHATGNATDELARLVYEGMLSPADWRERMRQEIKTETIRQYLLGRGGLDQMTAEDWGSVGGTISAAYSWLDRRDDNFYSLVEAGDLSEAEIARRSRMYVKSAREGYERALKRRLRDSDYNEEKWNTTAEESCQDCLDLAALDWVEIGTLTTIPGAGDTACLTNCACFISYRVSETGELFGEDEATERVSSEIGTHAHEHAG